MPHTIRDRKKLLARVRRIRGQADALERALNAETECAAILQQIAAIRGAVSGLMNEVIEGHLREHVALRAGAVGKRELEPVLRVLKSYLK